MDHKRKLYMRLVRYKAIKKEVDEFTEWEERNSENLLNSWKSYFEIIKEIPYTEYCMSIFKGTLENVDLKSLDKVFS